MRVLQEVSDNLNMLMDEKKQHDAFPHPDPGRNTKRLFINATMESNRSPVDFDHCSARVPFFEQAPKPGGKAGPNDKRWEPFNLFPAVYSKYSSKEVNQIGNFENQLSRRNEKEEERKADGN
jgi:hypothetical protein